MHSARTTVLLSALVGAVVGSGVTLLLQNNPRQHARPSTEQERIKEFYDIENAVHVSPHTLRKHMSRGDVQEYVLVDLRSQEEYEQAHIVTAVNIPAYKDPNTSATDEKDRIIGQFRELKETNPDKDIIVYCYSMPCMTGRKIGKMLADDGIFVRHLGIGWNEWRYFWNLWNHDGETPTTWEDFVATGKEPGVPAVRELPSPCGDGAFDC